MRRLAMELLEAVEGSGYLLLACYVFLGVSILCDAHLCPALDKLCDHLKIPPSLAAATFVSFGSSAPELIISSLGAVSNKTELSIPAVLVSALIAFAAIPPMVVKASGNMDLRIMEVVRDAFSYLVALLMFLYINQQPEIGIGAAASLVGLYCAYLLLVFYTSSADDYHASEDGVGDETAEGEAPNLRIVARERQNSTVSTSSRHSNGIHHSSGGIQELARSLQCCKRRGSYGSQPQRHEVPVAKTMSLVEPLHKKEESEVEAEEEEDWPVLGVLQRPFEKAFEHTVCDSAVLGFVLSMAWLCILSYAAMWCAEKVVDCWGISTTTAGVTLLAWGGQLPDAIAAVALARSGKPDEAISQAIASQVINVSVGLGMPMMTYSIATGQPTRTSHRNTVSAIAAVVLLSIVAYLLAMVPSCAKLREWQKMHIKEMETTITGSRACFIVVSFIFLYSGAIAIGEYSTSLTS